MQLWTESLPHSTNAARHHIPQKFVEETGRYAKLIWILRVDDLGTIWKQSPCALRYRRAPEQIHEAGVHSKGKQVGLFAIRLTLPSRKELHCTTFLVNVYEEHVSPVIDSVPFSPMRKRSLLSPPCTR